MADACVFIMKHYSGEQFLNVGTGHDPYRVEACRETFLEG